MPKTKRRKISDKGINMIAQFEGCELKAYQCPAGKWTIRSRGKKTAEKRFGNI